jgi:hypothetical protein
MDEYVYLNHLQIVNPIDYFRYLLKEYMTDRTRVQIIRDSYNLFSSIERQKTRSIPNRLPQVVRLSGLRSVKNQVGLFIIILQCIKKLLKSF